MRLQAVDDSLGPLGPLGDNAPAAANDLPPLPPQKEQLVLRQPAGSKFGSRPADVNRKTIETDEVPEDIEPTAGPRIPPPVQPSQGVPTRRDTQPSVSIEQAAKPSFDITVGDPHKVGDLTSSHIVYLVKTKASTSFQSENTPHAHRLSDHVKSLSSTRICRHSKIQRFPMAIQLFTCEQSWRGCAATPRETSCWSI